MAHDPRAIANYLLDYAASRSCGVTVMTLIKVIYFAHGWRLVQAGQPLSREGFEAWQHGPVIRSVWECFKGQAESPIDSRATRFDPVTQVREVVTYEFTREEADLLEATFNAYGSQHAFELSKITHEKGSPWDRVWNAPRDTINLGMRISDNLIREHFLTESVRRSVN